MSTKEKILAVALELFSRRGFSAVSVRDIAAEVGVRESAMYKHFPNKQAVFDRLIENYMQTCETFMSGIHAMPSADPTITAQTAYLYKQLTDEDFLKIGGSVFTDFLMQPDILKFSRIMSIERLNNEELAQLWNRHLFEAPIAFQTELFGMLIKIGAIEPIDPSMLALEFYAPLLTLYMNALPFEPDSTEFARALDFANRHMLHFREIYAIKEDKNK